MMTLDELRQREIATYQTMCAILHDMLSDGDESIRKGASRRIGRFQARIKRLGGDPEYLPDLDSEGESFIASLLSPSGEEYA